jgi:hypothetical protein
MNAPKDAPQTHTDSPATTPAQSQEHAELNATDVDAHVPATATTVQLGGETFTVLPMKVRQVFPFLQLARPIFAALATRPSSLQSGLPPADAGQDQGGEPDDVPLVTIEAAMGDADWMLDTLDKHGPHFVKALAVGVDTDPARLEELTVVDLVVLAKHFVAVNAGFFVDRGLRLPPNPFAAGAAVAPSPATPRAPRPRKR